MEEETKDLKTEEQADLSYFEAENEQEPAEEPREESGESEEAEDELGRAAAELLEKHPEIAEKLKSGEEVFTDGFSKSQRGHEPQRRL